MYLPTAAPGGDQRGSRNAMVAAYDPGQRRRWTAAKMAHGKTFSIIEVTAIAIIALSVAFIAFVGFSIWVEP